MAGNGAVLGPPTIEQADDELEFVGGKLASLYERLPSLDTFKLVVKELNLKSVTLEEGGTWEQASIAVAKEIGTFRKAEARVPPYESLA